MFSTGTDCKNRFGYLRDNIGEKTIVRALEGDPSFQLVVTFDDDVMDGDGGIGEELKQMFRQEIPEFEVFAANEPVYRLYKEGVINKSRFIEVSEEIIKEMGWRNAEYVTRFWSAYPENFS